MMSVWALETNEGAVATFMGLKCVISGENYMDIQQSLLGGPVSSTVVRMLLWF
jgi:hypothetical protein